MLNDLRNYYKLKGLNIDLLGKPENELKNQFLYYLGYKGKGINTGTLIFTFNENKGIIKIEVTEE